MKRDCKYFAGAKDGKRKIYIDAENEKQILEYFNRDKRHKNKIRFIVEIILGGHKNSDVYDKEDIKDKCKHVTAMKFFKGQDNDRIYCKEMTTPKGTFIVIAVILYEKKKNNKLTKEQINLIEKTASYQYEI